MIDLKPRFLDKISELTEDRIEAEAAEATKVKAVLDMFAEGTITEFELESKLRAFVDAQDDLLMTKAQVIGMLGGHDNL